ncbi:NAD-binding protein [Phellopilus nigrolimitatus]|nr:NAD-binding protein [Phellopilus nigrolimitatus]
MLQNLLVVGGNGFIGSAVCKAALARGMTVTSISSSGKPFRTPKGHAPAWTSKVTWLAGDALAPETYAPLLPAHTAVVHTLGTLLEDNGYKAAVRRGDVLGVAGSLLRSMAGTGTGNPLEEKVERRGSYEVLNRDAALTVCKTFAAASEPTADVAAATRRPFIYVSAEDIFRPFIPARYIETKREAERGITELLRGRSDLRAAFIRPSLVYHSHFRPLTTPVATVLDLFSTLHRAAPPGAPTPASVLRALGAATAHPSASQASADLAGGNIDLESSPLASVANALSVPPIHVDHVAEAICRVVLDDAVEGVVDVQRMRGLIGWADKGQSAHEHVAREHI